VSGSGISWAICKSAPRSRQITMPAPHRSVFYRPDAQPTVSKHWRHSVTATTHKKASMFKPYRNLTFNQLHTPTQAMSSGPGLASWNLLTRFFLVVFDLCILRDRSQLSISYSAPSNYVFLGCPHSHSCSQCTCCTAGADKTVLPQTSFPSCHYVTYKPISGSLCTGSTL